MSKKDTDVGKETEQMVARWLRGNGFHGAERTVRTAYRVHGREFADQGDIDGCPGICWQVKSLRPATRAELAAPGWLAETRAQQAAGKAMLGFLVVRRWGTTDVGRWWVFQTASQLYHLLGGKYSTSYQEGYDAGRLIPVRMDMAALSGLLQLTGWADAKPVEDVS